MIPGLLCARACSLDSTAVVCITKDNAGCQNKSHDCLKPSWAHFKLEKLYPILSEDPESDLPPRYNCGTTTRKWCRCCGIVKPAAASHLPPSKQSSALLPSRLPRHDSPQASHPGKSMGRIWHAFKSPLKPRLPPSQPELLLQLCPLAVWRSISTTAS